MAKYGIPYQGSKSKIAEHILDVLPSGNRLVDLFGGGFSITHCAMEKYSDKWNAFYYNDINPLLAPLIKDAISGKYSYNNFKPEWISREQFFELKETDGYVKWCWSFGNNGRDYLYGKNVEDDKHQIHDFIVFGIKPDFVDGITLTSRNIHDRRMEWIAKCESLCDKVKGSHGYRNGVDIKQLQHLQRLEHLQELEHLQLPQQLEMTCHDYRDYKYQDGDIVYCDIPYEDSTNAKIDYGCAFNHKEFYQWAKA